MSFAVHPRTEPGPTQRDATIYVLQHGADAWAEVWPALGFNCIRWQVKQSGDTLDLLYDDPDLFGEGRPTRSGIPVLFPFPNRVRDGRFVWDGQEYQLPRNESNGKSAIHGFAFQRTWPGSDQGAGARPAGVTGEFAGVLTDGPGQPDAEGLFECATIAGAAGATLRVRCSPAFRQLVVYTPAHRQAFCVEPYTCVTDAVNLQARGMDAGWLVLQPGEKWTAVVEMGL